MKRAPLRSDPAKVRAWNDKHRKAFAAHQWLPEPRAWHQAKHEPEVRTCEYCGEAFTSYLTSEGRTRYCSQRCGGSANAKTETKPCTVCGKPITTMARNRRKTCSSQCAREAKSRAKRGSANPNYLEPEEKAARRARKKAGGKPCARPECTEKVLWPRRYCSPACQYADAPRANVERGNRGALLVYECERCGAEFSRPPKRGIGRFCSMECKQAGPLPRTSPPAPIRTVRPRPHQPKTVWDTGTLSCIYPGCDRDGRVHRHHVVYAQHALAAGAAQYDVRNRAGLCRFHHYAHHGRNLVVPIIALPDEALGFGFEVLGPAAFDYFRRYYSGHDPRLDALLADYPEPGGTPGSR